MKLLSRVMFASGFLFLGLAAIGGIAAILGSPIPKHPQGLPIIVVMATALMVAGIGIHLIFKE